MVWVVWMVWPDLLYWPHPRHRLEDVWFGLRDEGFGVRNKGFGLKDEGFRLRNEGLKGYRALKVRNLTSRYSDARCRYRPVAPVLGFRFMK